MAAKRLGSVLTNITGTSGQLLRVKTDESGFEFVTPSTIPSYSVSNKTIDRAINCSNSNVDELANVLGTLIDDLTAIGAPGSTQQVYQSGTYSNTNSNQGTSYTINHNLGIVPDMIKVYSLDNGQYQEWPSVQIDNSVVYGFQSDGSWTTTSAKVRVFSNPLSGGSPINIIFRVFVIGQVAQVAPFQWSTSEQVWPSEKGDNGETIYCRKVVVGSLPNNGEITQTLPTGITQAKVIRYYGKAVGSQSGEQLWYLLPHVQANTNYQICLRLVDGAFKIGNIANYSGLTGTVYILYAK